MSHDTRFKGGVGWGPYNNFFARSDNVFAQNDTTPDVTDGNLFYTNNTTTTVITHFDLSLPGGGAGSNAGDFEGKEIKVFFLDDSTSLANAGRLILASTNSLQGPNNSITLIYHNSSWMETARSYNQSNFINVSSVGLNTATGNPFMNASTGNVNVTGRGNQIVIRHLAETGSDFALRRAFGGEQGAILTIIAGGGSHSLVIVNSAAADTFVSTSSASSTQFRLVSSAAISFVRILNKWHEITPVNVTSGTSVSGV